MHFGDYEIFGDVWFVSTEQTNRIRARAAMTMGPDVEYV